MKDDHWLIMLVLLSLTIVVTIGLTDVSM